MMVTINLRLWKGSKKRPKHDTNLSFAVLGSCRWQNDNHLIKLVFQLLVLTRDKTKMVPVCSWSQILLSCCSATPRYSQQLSSWSCIVAWILSIAFQWLVCNRVILGLWTDFCRNHCSVSVAKHFSWNRPRSHHSSELTRQGDSIYSWVQAVSCLCVSVPGCRKEREALWWAGTHDSGFGMSRSSELWGWEYWSTEGEAKFKVVSCQIWAMGGKNWVSVEGNAGGRERSLVCFDIWGY